MHRLLLASLAVTFGCRQILGIESGTEVPSDGLFDGDRDSAPVPDAGMCKAVSLECASADVLRVCSTLGAFPTDTLCAWGCTVEQQAHCAELEPRGGALVSSDLQPSSMFAQLTLASDHVIDTEVGRIGTAANPSSIRPAGNGVLNGIEFQTRGEVGVFRVAGLSQSGQTGVIGSNALAIATNGDVTLNGVIDMRGACVGTNAGPGGSVGGSAQSSGPGLGGGLGGIAPGVGGGGGAFGGRGGAGGSTSGVDNRFGDPNITKLAGGGGGGGGGGNGGGAGGGGGGAFQIASNGTVSIAVGGGINAGGCGGKAGSGSPTDGGGGGGAGGVILIEARNVNVSGVLAVNGGGGGGGTQTAGAPGRLDRLSAAGGVSGGGGGAAGPLIDGILGSSTAGGGGGIGRIRINTRTGVVSGNGTLSPNFSDAGTTATRGVAVVR